MDPVMIGSIIFILLLVFGIIAYIIYNAKKSPTSTNNYSSVYGGVSPFCPPGCSRLPTGGCWKDNGRFRTPCPY